MSKPILCDFCQEKLNKRESWEVNFKKEIEESCKINEGWKEFKGKKVCEHGYKICGWSNAGYDYEMIDPNDDLLRYKNSTGMKTTTAFSCKDCRKDQKKITKNSWGDKLEEKISNGCQCHKEEDKPREREREREREQLLNYFKDHNIQSITLKGNELIIEYQNSQTETKLANTSELQVIQSYCQSQNLNTLSASDLQSQTQIPQPFNWKSPWVIGTGIVLVAGMIGLVAYLVNKNKKED